MRVSRSLQLQEDQGSVHLIWRCHNKEKYLATNQMRDLYLDCVKFSINKKVEHKENVKVHAYCVMSNHYHQFTTYKNGSINLSKHMRLSHGVFGARYNKKTGRSGKVADSRPKTPLIENLDHEMRVHFYIEANPIRAGICSLSELHLYKHNTYKYYAYGIKDNYSDILTVPDWYLALGKTEQARQAKYRRYFYIYVHDKILDSAMAKMFCRDWIGSVLWQEQMKLKIKIGLQQKKDNSENSS